MLVLARHLQESIIIGEDILITVVGIRGDMVRLGIEAPIDIRVDRLEVRARLDRDMESRRDGRDD